MRGILVALAVAVALVGGGCGKQPKFSIPICAAVDSGCGCMIKGWIICNHICIDPASDAANCGGCGNRCDSVCVGGKCADDCGGSDRCGDRCVSSTDPYNCGGCGKVCDGPCVDSSCQNPPIGEQINCPDGQMSCSGTCTDIAHDVFNCGGCRQQCPSVLGICYRDSGGKYWCCDGKLCDGKCTDVKSDPNNCGNCGVQCTNDCSFGSCR